MSLVGSGLDTMISLVLGYSWDVDLEIGGMRVRLFGSTEAT